MHNNREVPPVLNDSDLRSVVKEDPTRTGQELTNKFPTSENTISDH